VIEGDSPLRDTDQRVFVAPPPAAGQALLAVLPRVSRTTRPYGAAAGRSRILFVTSVGVDGCALRLANWPLAPSDTHPPTQVASYDRRVGSNPVSGLSVSFATPRSPACPSGLSSRKNTSG
jgi:hypothetical protein